MSAIHIPPDPRKGDALSAGWARSLVAALRAMRLSVCWPLTLTQTPEGTSLRLATGAGPLAGPLVCPANGSANAALRITARRIVCMGAILPDK